MKGFLAIATACVASALLLALPSMSAGKGGVLGPVFEAVDRTLQPIKSDLIPRGGSTMPDPRGDGNGEQPERSYQPPLHGDNPHGQGTILTIDLSPSEQRPLDGDPTGAGDAEENREEIVIGRSRGEQVDGGDYHGQVTVVSLFGNEVAGAETNEGEDADESDIPADEVQALEDLCSEGVFVAGFTVFACGSEPDGGSTTTDTSSRNFFSVASGSLELAEGDCTEEEPPPVPMADTRGKNVCSTLLVSNFGVASSEGCIAEEESCEDAPAARPGCQTAYGESSLAEVFVGPAGLISLLFGPPETRAVLRQGVSAESMTSSSESIDCENGTQQVNNDSRVVDLEPEGHDGEGNDPLCDDEVGEEGEATTPDTPFDAGFGISGFCNADDTNGDGEPIQQADDPYGVREALTYFQEEGGEDNGDCVQIPGGPCIPCSIAPELCEDPLTGAATRGGGETGIQTIKATFAGSESKASVEEDGGGGCVVNCAPPPPDQPRTPDQPGTPDQPDTTPPDDTPGPRDEPEREGGLEGQQDAPEGDEAPAESAPTAAEQGGLPFTGTDLLLTALIGTLVLLVGLSLQALVRRDERRS